MMLSDLDGLLHGVICSPSPISSDVWMAAGLGAEPKELPDWVVNTLTDRYMEIAQGLAHDPMVVELGLPQFITMPNLCALTDELSQTQ
jgi:uncharacterized protein